MTLGRGDTRAAGLDGRGTPPPSAGTRARHGTGAPCARAPSQHPNPRGLCAVRVPGARGAKQGFAAAPGACRGSRGGVAPALCSGGRANLGRTVVQPAGRGARRGLAVAGGRVEVLAVQQARRGDPVRRPLV
eukprot:scaffold4939_cov121-Isochrysis_galbana.AAC.11